MTKFKLIVICATAAVFIAASIGIGGSAAVRRQIDKWRLPPPTERVSELYFSGEVPRNYRGGQSQTLSFVVRNLEHQTAKYSYKIVQTANNNPAEPLVLQSGQFALTDGQSQTTTLNVLPADLGKRCRFAVILNYSYHSSYSSGEIKKEQSIHYWAEREGSDR